MDIESTMNLLDQITREFKKVHPSAYMFPDIEFTVFSVLSTLLCLPTIQESLELYNSIREWKDKPDKEGWWWYAHNSPVDGEIKWTFRIYCVWESQSGILKSNTLPLIDDLRSIDDLNSNGFVGKWLYIPEPHITNPTPDGGNL